MNNTNEKEKHLFKKFANTMWILHKVHQKTHHKHTNMKKNYDTCTKNRILSLLKLQKEISKKELEFILDIPKHHFDQIIEKMAETEYIITAESEVNSDIIVKLTEKGEKAEIKAEKSKLDSLFDCLTDEEKENLGIYLDTIASSVKLNFDNSSDFFRDDFSEEEFWDYEMKERDFYKFFPPFHKMNKDFRDHKDEFRPHRHPDFNERYRMNRRRHEDFDPHENLDFERDGQFDDFDKRHNPECERRGYSHAPHNNPDYFNCKKR